MKQLFKILIEQEAKAFLKKFLDETMAMIDYHYGCTKTKLDSSINALFQVTILKLVAKRKGGEAKQSRGSI